MKELVTDGRSSRIAVAVILMAAIASFALGLTPWLAPLAALVGLSIAIGQRTSWAFAFAASVIVQLVAAAVVLRLTPAFHCGLTAPVAVLLGLAALPGVVVLVRRRRLRVPRGPQLVAAAIVTVGIASAVLVIIQRALPGGHFEWAMHNDAVWNTVTTRFIINDGGVDAAAHPNSSPLTAMVMAAAASVGRSAVSATQLLEHDIVAFATFWLLAAGVSCVLAGLIGYRALPASTPTRRWAAAIATGLIPSTWFVFGVATSYGFFNGTIVVILLCASWLVWLDADAQPMFAAFVLSLATVCLLATWAPLAVLPLSLAITALARRVRDAARRDPGCRRRTLLLAVVTLLPVPLYALLVTIPDLRRDGGALSVEGAFIPLRPVHLVMIAGVTLAVVFIVAARRNDRHRLVGTLVVVVGGILALSYLLLQRVTAASLWGYYPAKFSWFVCILLLVVLSAEIARGVLSMPGGRAWAAPGLALAVIVPGALMANVPPADGWRTASTPVAIALGFGSATKTTATQELFDLAEAGMPTIALDYASAPTDEFLNSWLLQLESTTSRDPIRNFSYFLSPGDEKQACTAIKTWDKEVRVVTNDHGLRRRLAAECPDNSYRVEVLTNPTAVAGR